MKEGLTSSFLQQIENLIYHKDPSVVFGVLIILEYLVSSTGMTEEIWDSVEIPKYNKLNKQNFCEK